MASDWTAGLGPSNSSPLFTDVARAIGQLIRDDLRNLMFGGAGPEAVGGLVAAHLAHSLEEPWLSLRAALRSTTLSPAPRGAVDRAPPPAGELAPAGAVESFRLEVRPLGCPGVDLLGYALEAEEGVAWAQLYVPATEEGRARAQRVLAALNGGGHG